MPPKPDKKKVEVLINGVNLIDLTRENVEVFVLKLKEELDRKREQRNNFQVERDGLSSSWEACRLRINELEVKIRILDREAEEYLEQAKESEIFQKQKGKYEIYENKILSEEYQEEHDALLKQDRLEHSQTLARINKEKGELKEKIKLQEANYQDELKKMLAAQKEDKEKIQSIYDEKMKQLEIDAETRQDYLLKKMEIQQIDLAEVEERFNKHLDVLHNSHEESFEHLKAFYNEQTTKSLGVINGILAEIELLKNDMRSSKDTQKKFIELYDGKQGEFNLLLEDLLIAKKRRDNCNRLKTALDNRMKQLKQLEIENSQIMKETIALDEKVRETNWERGALKRTIARKLKT